jgi:peptidoglycan/LPS O-acetylase OafA/YrhL
MSPYLLFAVSLPISLIAGYVSWHLVERWFLASRRVSESPTKTLDLTP